MATYGRTIRRGLPRVAGGEPWPAAGDSPLAEGAIAEPVVAEPVESAVAAAAVPVATAPAATPMPTAQQATPLEGMALRRGLPRTPGGEPWPPESAAVAAAPTAQAPTQVQQAEVPQAAPVPTDAAANPAANPAQQASQRAEQTVALRRGLPRTPGGEPWPAAGSVAAAPQTPAVQVQEPEAPEPAPQASREVATVKDYATPLPFKKTVWAGAYANVPVVTPEKKRIGRFTRGQWAGITVLAGGALLFAAAMAVITVRFLVSLPAIADFLNTYPGHIEPPAETAEGFPAWARWQHYLNAFFMLLIIRTGWTVRNDRRPGAFFTPRWSKNGKGKISLTLWLHLALDLLWVINGIIFIVLLFVSGHWARLVPTSWDVVPNAVSAGLQYVSLDWPAEHGWVYYNSLQQLMYFAVVFVAAPLAIITGVRMSNLWPKNAAKLNRIYPVEVARAIHFPTMLFFVLFIVVHVFLVFSTGARVNLNHMFTGTDELNWTGFWLFFAGLVVMVAAWLAVRPLVIAPIAKLFGKVSMR